MKPYHVLFYLLLLAGCANSDLALMQQSAIAIGDDVHPDSVQLQNVHRTMTDVTWDAVTYRGAFNCYGDDMLRRVRCVPRQQ